MSRENERSNATSAGLNSPLKWHVEGGKHYLANRIVAMMPPHIHYVEPYAGGLSVLLAKDPEGVSEVVNDLHSDLTNFWWVLQQPDLFARLKRRLEATPFSEAEYERACDEQSSTPVGLAHAFFVRCRQSHAGRMDGRAAFSRTRTRRGMNEQVSSWLSTIDRLPEIHARLLRVAVTNRPALELIRGQDGPATLFYLDPPYLHETRAVTDAYRHEMGREDHIALLEALSDIKGKFLLSGYRSDLYDDMASGNAWHRTDFDLPNHAAGGKEKRRMTECVWTNFPPNGT